MTNALDRKTLTTYASCVVRVTRVSSAVENAAGSSRSSAYVAPAARNTESPAHSAVTSSALGGTPWTNAPTRTVT